MKKFFREHRKMAWAGGAAAGILFAVLIFMAFFDWNLFRPALARIITARTGRPVSIDGDLKAHLWSWNPSAEVNGLRILNPDWAERKVMFGARQITVTLSLPRLLRGQIVLPRVDLVEPEINLERDSTGRASWELGTPEGKPNHRAQPAKLPTLRSLTVESGRLHVVDQMRKLSFSGSLVAAEQAGLQNDSAFKIRSIGSLNSKPFRLDANGGPLFDLDPHQPYSFSANVEASDIKLETRVTVLKPFDLGDLDVEFVVSGNDLADVYYLTGLALPNTPGYRIAALVHVDGTQFTIDRLQGRLGTSDLSGQLRLEVAGERPKLTASLASSTLNLADLAPTLGQPAPKPTSLSAAARPAPGAAISAAADAAVRNQDARWLFPDADLQVNRVRGMDADVTYQADSVIAKVPMQKVTFHLVLDNGLLRLDPLAFVLDQGRFHGSVQIDARNSVPVSDIDMRIDDIDLSQFKSAAMKRAPLQGSMQGRVKFHGSGSSLHKFASASNGAMSVVIPHGQVSDVMAELTGINVLRGLGLLLSKNEQQTEIRCGVVDFKDQEGRLNATTLYIDTSNVLITGRGSVNLDSEVLDLALQGDPKKLRLLRLRSPITLRGTLRHPAVGVNVGKLAQQGGVAAALGVLLTPVAAAIAFIDPGLAKNKDCATVVEQGNAGVRN